MFVKFFFPILLCLMVGCSTALQEHDYFRLSPAIYQQQAFIPHTGRGPWDNYLAMNVNYPPVKEFRENWERRLSRQLKNRGEAHITVITPPEFHGTLRKRLSMNEIHELSRDIQKASFKVICLGEGRLGQESTYYFVVESEELRNIRRSIHQLYIKKGGKKSDWNPEHYYPHITLGYTERDLHEADGIIKGQHSCLKKIQVKD